MLLPFKSLDAASATGPGAAVDCQGLVDTFTLQVAATGSPSDWTVHIDGSLDGVTWGNLPGGQLGAGSNPYQGGTCPPFRYLRANLISITGGTSPTFTAYVAGRLSSHGF